ncbi:MAG: imidazole glycerol phosphate synthase subunit HisH [Fluviibacter sp.]
MSTPVTLIDYGIGNLLNTVRALEHCGAAVKVIGRAGAGDVDADRLILPGVGAFGDGMQELRARGFDDLIRRFADTGRPFLGICVGMQVMFETGEEMGEHAGLGLMPGRVRAIPATDTAGRPHRVPHIGWRPLLPARDWQGSVLADAVAGERAYFVHSFSAHPADEALRLADVDYDGRQICAAVSRDNLHGCQFHPERSAGAGLRMLCRFLAL